MLCASLILLLLLTSLAAPLTGRAAERPTPRPSPRAAPHAAPVPEARPPAQADRTPKRGSVTGQPIPRFVALRANKVNMRVGPGLRYPIKWVYQRRNLPMEVEREFYAWRFVRDADGVEGWMHQSTLVNRRNFIVTGKQCTLRSGPNPRAPAVARLNPGVIGTVRHCAAGATRCQVSVNGYTGWLDRQSFWGTLRGEAVGN